MKKATNKKRNGDLRPEYNFASMKGGVRGKYAERFKAGTNLVLLSPDVAKHFRDGESVNDALRELIVLAKGRVRHSR
jgi:hypothetical protein